jgi:hypothetical protein
MEVIRPLQDAIAVLEAQLAEANARAVRAEDAVAGQRDRADGLRDRLDALQAELQQAQEATRIAIGALKARQAEEARKARGRIAADDLRRVVRLARWRPRSALRRLWARLRVGGRGRG